MKSLFFYLLLALACNQPKNTAAKREIRTSDVLGQQVRPGGEPSPTQSNASGAGGTDTGTNMAVSGLYTYNQLPQTTGPNTDTAIYGSKPSFVGSTGADCNVHTNRPMGDPCSYDFCGANASSQYLTAPDFKTMTALVSALKTQGKFPTPCSNSAVLSALGSLTSLDLSNQGLSNIAALSICQKLTTLDLDSNQISDLSPLSQMSQLQILKANSNQLTRLSGLSNDLALTQIYVSNNKITTISDIVPLMKLTSLDLNNNNVASVIPLTNRRIAITVSGNPGILTEATTVAKGVTVEKNDCFGTQPQGQSFFGCAFNTAILVFNYAAGNKPIPTQNPAVYGTPTSPAP